MTPQDYIAQLTAQGLSVTAAVQQLAELLCCSRQTAWRVYSGSQKPSPAALQLLHIWAHCPEARKLWKGVSQSS